MKKNWSDSEWLTFIGYCIGYFITMYIFSITLFAGQTIYVNFMIIVCPIIFYIGRKTGFIK